MLAAFACAAAYLAAILAVPQITRLAVHHRLLDYPDGDRRLHARPVPRLGGVAVGAGLLVAYATLALLVHLSGGAYHLPRLMPAALAGSAILFVVGLVDDIRGVRPTAKILAQTAAALIVYRAGFSVETLILPGNVELHLGALAFPVTALWIVGLSNAFNLVDGMDGLAGGVAMIALLATAASAAILGNAGSLVVCFALIGAIGGFLRYNLPPARIFLGDSGSLVVGFFLAVYTVRGATRPGVGTFVLAPLFALSYPLLDTGISMLRRWLRGDPLSRADGRHIHHQILKLGLAPAQAVLLICSEAAGIALLGLSATFAPPRLTLAIAAIGGAILLFILVYGVRWLHYNEFLALGTSVKSAVRQGRTVVRDKIHAADLADLLGRATSLEQVESLLRQSAPTFRFIHLQLEDRVARTPYSEPAVVQRHGAQSWRLEYPVAPFARGVAHPLSLVIWCAMDGNDTPAGAERIAAILAPSIATWLATHWTEPSLQKALGERFPAARTPAWGQAAVGGTRGPKLLA